MGFRSLTTDFCLRIDRTLFDVLRPPNREKAYQGETACLPEVTFEITRSVGHIFSVEDRNMLGKVKLI